MKKYLFLIPLLFPIQTFALFDPLSAWRIYNLILNIYSLVFPFALFLVFFFIIRSIYLRIKYRKKESHKKENKRVIKSTLWLFLLVTIWATLGTLQSSNFLRPEFDYSNCPLNGCMGEFHAANDIYNRPDVKPIMKKYSRAFAWVKPLNYKYIEDKEYLDRILPGYSELNIHCIVVAHSPEGTRFFLEDGDIHHNYIEVSSEKFLESLNNAPDEDVNNFWLGLR